MYAPAYWTERPNGGPVQNFRRDGQIVEFEIHGAGGRYGVLFPFRYMGRDAARHPWTYTGTVSADGSTIKGVWTQELGRSFPTDFECIE
jgi:hypothetical protein